MPPAVPTRHEEILAALEPLVDPETGRPLVGAGQIRELLAQGERVALRLALSSFAAPLAPLLVADAKELLQNRFPGLTAVEVGLAPLARPAAAIGQIGLKAKAVVAVGSGKGGVGKSTVSASLAYALKNSGCKVGLLDADVYGPSQPLLVGVPMGQPPEVIDKQIQPVEVDGLKMISMGLVVPPGQAIVWRGPMLHQAITQFLRDTAWGELDYLVIDMPPGTGDIALTLSQLLPLTGAVVVCTPQDVALIDAEKAIAMFQKVNIPVLGMVENMSYFLCPGCNQRYDIFGSGGAQKKAQELNLPFLGEVPIQMQIRVNGDTGRAGASVTDSASGPYFQTLAVNLARQVAQRRFAEPPLPTLNLG